jgi:ketosteroid isomerase-like protein
MSDLHAPLQTGPRPGLGPLALTALALWLAPLLTGCRANPASADSSGRHAITQVIDAYLDAYRRNDPDAIAGLYSGDAVLLPPGHELVRGRDDIRTYWGRGMEAGFAMDTLRIESAGGSGYVVGRYYVPPDEDDDAETGKFVIALRRDPDGVWRITADIWNADTGDSNEPEARGDSAAKV